MPWITRFSQTTDKKGLGTATATYMEDDKAVFSFSQDQVDTTVNTSIRDFAKAAKRAFKKHRDDLADFNAITSKILTEMEKPDGESET